MLNGHPVNIQGFEIPSSDPVFLAILSVHVLAGLTCVVAGLIAILSPKKRGRHSKSGMLYYRVLLIVFISATVIAILRWKEDYHLFLLGAVSFASAVIGRIAIKRKWKRWSITHTVCMGSSYIFLLIAFYVDNGKFLPLWKKMNPVFYWLLPLVIGTVIIVRSLYTHPLTQNYFRAKEDKRPA